MICANKNISQQVPLASQAVFSFVKGRKSKCFIHPLSDHSLEAPTRKSTGSPSQGGHLGGWHTWTKGLCSGTSPRGGQRKEVAPHYAEGWKRPSAQRQPPPCLRRKQRAARPPLSRSLWLLMDNGQSLEVILPGTLAGTKAGRDHLPEILSKHQSDKAAELSSEAWKPQPQKEAEGSLGCEWP